MRQNSICWSWLSRRPRTTSKPSSLYRARSSAASAESEEGSVASSTSTPKGFSGRDSRTFMPCSIAATANLRHVIHEVVVSLGGAGTGDLVVASLHFSKAGDDRADIGLFPAAGAVFVPVDGDLVARD